MIAYLLSIVKLDRSILIYVFTWSTIGFLHLGMMAVLTNLYLLRLGFDITFLGVYNGVFQIAWALFAFPAGLIGMRFGLRNSLVAVYFLAMAGALIFLSSAWFPAAVQPGALYLSNILVGMSAATVMVNGAPYVMSIARPEDRSKAFTLQAAFFSLMAFLGSLLAGILPAQVLKLFPAWQEAQAFNAVMWLAVPLYLFAALLMMTARVEPKITAERKTGAAAAAPVPLLLFLGLFMVLVLGGEFGVGIFINVYFSEELLQPAAMIGTVFASARLLAFLMSPLLPFLLGRLGAGRSVALFSLLMAVCGVLLGSFPILAVAVIVMLLSSIIGSFGMAARSLFSQEIVLPQWRTLSSAVLSISMAVAGGLIGFSSGPIIAAFGFKGLFFTSAALSMLGLLVYTVWDRRRARTPQVMQPEPAPTQ
jgi:fucose permease